MWLGLLHLTMADGDDVEADTAIIVAYERDRLFSAAGPVAMAPQIVRLLREAAGETGGCYRRAAAPAASRSKSRRSTSLGRPRALLPDPRR